MLNNNVIGGGVHVRCMGENAKQQCYKGEGEHVRCKGENAKQQCYKGEGVHVGCKGDNAEGITFLVTIVHYYIYNFSTLDRNFPYETKSNMRYEKLNGKR